MQETKVSFVCSASAFQNNHQSFAVLYDVLQDDEQDTKQASRERGRERESGRVWAKRHRGVERRWRRRVVGGSSGAKKCFIFTH